MTTMNYDGPRFEGSYMGTADKISPQAIMECKICWTPYDPADGDEYRQVLPGTPFLALPEDWKCPNCDAPKEQFMVLEDPGNEAVLLQEKIDERAAVLVQDFKDAFATSMRGLPVINQALHVEAVGFQAYGDDLALGVLVTPWFMNLIVMPVAEGQWNDLKIGTKEVMGFPSGEYEFIHAARGQIGGYKACSLFSPMEDFTSQMQALDVARAVMGALFDAENREETDRAADIREAREQELAEIEAAEVAAKETDNAKGEAPDTLSRRSMLGLKEAETDGGQSLPGAPEVSTAAPSEAAE